MKKFAITLSAVLAITVSSQAFAYTKISSIPPVPEFVPVSCPLNTQTQKQNCDPAPVFSSCEEVEQWRLHYFEKRIKLYAKLCLTQEQRIKAKCIDEKFFDEIAPLKMCKKQEEKKLNDLKCKKGCKDNIKAQKEKIKDLKAEIKDKKKQHDCSFEAILSKCQKETYKELMKDKCKKHKKPKCECGCK